MKRKNFFISVKKHSEIQSLFSNKNTCLHTFHNNYFKCKFLVVPQNSLLPLHILWAIPKKIGKANQRNLIRRRMQSTLFESLKIIMSQPSNIKYLSHKYIYNSYTLRIAFIPKENIFQIKYSKLLSLFSIFLKKNLLSNLTKKS